MFDVFGVCLAQYNSICMEYDIYIERERVRESNHGDSASLYIYIYIHINWHYHHHHHHHHHHHIKNIRSPASYEVQVKGREDVILKKLSNIKFGNMKLGIKNQKFEAYSK